MSVTMKEAIQAQTCDECGAGCGCVFEEGEREVMQLSSRCCVHGEAECSPERPSPVGHSVREHLEAVRLRPIDAVSRAIITEALSQLQVMERDHEHPKQWRVERRAGSGWRFVMFTRDSRELSHGFVVSERDARYRMVPLFERSSIRGTGESQHNTPSDPHTEGLGGSTDE